MRVISGQFKGLRLFGPKDRQFRPTQDKVKEAIFDILQGISDGAQVLDLFCGTGGLGIETLSRGAEHVVFVDRSVAYLKKNLSLIKKKNYTIRCSPVDRYIKACRSKFDLIFMDPPWNESDLYERALKAICTFDILAPDGILVVEHRKKYHLPVPSDLTIRSVHNYGESQLTMLHHPQ